MKRFLPEIVVLCALFLAASYGFAQTWTKTTAGGFAFFTMAESSDGRKILALGSGTTTSTNSGVTWGVTAPLTYGAGAGFSADGSKVVASFSALGNNGFVYLSGDSGNTWTPTSLPQTNWSACASSGNGNTLVAVVHTGYIYTSTNAGVNWRTNTALGPKAWAAVAASANGLKLVAAASGDQIYTSSNAGVNWSPAGSTSSAWRAVAMSFDGKYVAAASPTTTILSTNGGTSWRTLSMVGYGVACSANGSRLIIGNTGGNIYVSTNFGVSWASTNITGKQFYSVASSADGYELVAGENSGIWMWQATPSPKLGATTSSNNMLVSWLVPSANFALQQTADLTAGWVTLTNVPAINPTNLQNQVVLSSTNGNGFYRLVTP